MLLSHADRSRVVSEEERAALSRAGGIGYGSVLVDGFARAVWRVEGDTLVVSHLPLAKRHSRRSQPRVGGCCGS